MLDPKTIDDSFARFLELLAYVRETDGEVLRSDLLFDIESIDGRRLDELLTSRDFDRDLRAELFGRLDKVETYGEDPPGLEVVVDDQVLSWAPSVALCLAKTLKGLPMGSLTTAAGGLRGARDVKLRGDSLAGTVHFLVDADDAPAFWRAVIHAEPDAVTRLDRYGHLPFPNCVFAPEVWRQINSFDGAILDNWPLLLANLAGLDDHAVRIWGENVESAVRQRLMSSVAGVNCSPESPGTHRNSAAMRRRRVRFGDREIVCEWHAKLQRDRNRVHFAVEDGRVFVGIFVGHLPT
ncbi:hypothetical protein OG225_37305 [Nocardia sp. NBC_01377]|uniref:hypothetical protein n=1 Tax=Nocardia sp. NBC_01377 TaxID=2903595 RepID=UPI00324AF298